MLCLPPRRAPLPQAEPRGPDSLRHLGEGWSRLGFGQFWGSVLGSSRGLGPRLGTFSHPHHKLWLGQALRLLGGLRAWEGLCLAGPPQTREGYNGERAGAEEAGQGEWGGLGIGESTNGSSLGSPRSWMLGREEAVAAGMTLGPVAAPGCLAAPGCQAPTAVLAAWPLGAAW